MYEILNFFQTVINFAFQILILPLNIYGLQITLFEVLIFVFIGSLLWGFILAIFS